MVQVHDAGSEPPRVQEIAPQFKPAPPTLRSCSLASDSFRIATGSKFLSIRVRGVAAAGIVVEKTTFSAARQTSASSRA